MKKHLIAAAVAAAVAVPAMAQNVTLSGNLEANYGRIDTGAVSTAGMNGSIDVFGGSDFKISGVEDLGGGLKAGFSLLMEFDENTGRNINSSVAGVAVPNSAPAEISDRTWRDIQLFVSGGFGEVKVGRFIAAHRDLGGVYRFNGDFGRISSVFNTIGNRPDNQIQYTTPTMSGITLSVAHAKADANGIVAVGSQSGYSLRYADGPLRVQASSASLKRTDNGLKDKESAIGGSYALGDLRIGAAFFKEDTANQANEAEGMTLQLDYAMGGGINVFGSYNNYEHTADGRDGSAYAIGASKALSKRTKVFAVHNNDKNDVAATWVFRNGTAPAQGNDSSRTVIGIAHSF